MKFNRKVKLAVTGIVGATVLSACGYSVPSDLVALQIGSGPTEAAKVKDCKAPGDRGFWTNDTYVYLPGPQNQRVWDMTGQDGSDGKPVQSSSSDNVVMNVPITVRFTLKGDCKTLEQFYVNHVRRSGAAFHQDGSYNKQWESMLRGVVGDPVDQTVDRVVKSYDWRTLAYDANKRAEISNKIQDDLRDEKNSLLTSTDGGSFFTNINVLLGTPTPQDDKLKEAVASQQTAVANADAQTAQAKAQVAQAQAQTAVAEANAAKQNAEINGYGGFENYNKAQAVQKGLNPYQPTYIVNGTQPSK